MSGQCIFGSSYGIRTRVQMVHSVMLLGVSGAQSSQAQQQKVFVDLQKLVEAQEREVRARRELEARLQEARRDSRKFQTELQQAQKEAESYKGRLQEIHKCPTDQESAVVVDVSGVSSVSTGEQLARQLFLRPGSLQGLGNVNVMTADAVDMLSQVAQGSPSIAQVVVAETVVDEGDITCSVPSNPNQSCK